MIFERLSKSDATMTYVLSGRMTGAAPDFLLCAVNDIKGKAFPRVILDLARVESVDSMSLGMLLLLSDSAISNGVHVVLRGAQEPVLKTIQAARLDQIFEMI